MPTLRGSTIKNFFNTAVTVQYPVGTVAGDLAVVAAGNVQALSNPSGWTVADNTTGGNWSGAAWSKMLDSADIASIAVEPTCSFSAAGSGYYVAGAFAQGSPTIRGHGIQSSSASSYSVSWPAGTIAGDLAIIFAGHGFAASNPGGWTVLDNSTGGNWNGAAWSKVLDAADITAGSITITFTGAFNGVLAIITFVGAPTLRTPIAAGRSGAGATTTTIASSGGLATTDVAVYFASNRGSSTDTINRGTQQRTVTAASASGCLYTESIPSQMGSVVINASVASAKGIVALATIQTGTFTTTLRNTAALRNSTNLSPRAVSTDSTPLTGDLALYFGSNSATPSTDTVDRGSLLGQTSSNGSVGRGSGCLYNETLAGGGTVTANFSYSLLFTGDYQAIIVIAPGSGTAKARPLLRARGTRFFAKR